MTDIVVEVKPTGSGHGFTVYLAGVNHNDPLMRRELVDWLRDLKNEHETQPCFVAVEWGQEAHALVVAARDEFKELARGKWPCISVTLLAGLADAMAYEGDAHRELWPDLEPIWLDDDRPLTRGRMLRLLTWADGNLRLYEGILEGIDPVNDPDAVLNQIRVKAHEDQLAWQGGGERDESWAKQILKAIREECDWAVVIAGPGTSRTTLTVFVAFGYGEDPLRRCWSRSVSSAGDDALGHRSTEPCRQCLVVGRASFLDAIA